MNICIVIPVLNEAKKIGALVAAIKAKGLDVIVIDDGSTDHSGTIAKDQGAFVLTNEQRQGKGNSLQQGFRSAVEQKYDGVIAMDGDGQHAVDDLPNFMAMIEKQPISVITGNRMENLEGMPFIRRITNQFMSFLISMACRQSIPDSQCGYRYISSDVLESIKLKTSGYEIESEVLIKASKKGFKIYSVPVKTIYEDEHSEIHPIKDTFRFFSYLIRETFGNPRS